MNAMTETTKTQYIKYLSTTRSERTVKCYLQDIEEYLLFTDVNNLSYLDETSIEKYKLNIEQKYSPTTITRKLYSIQTYIRYIENDNEKKIINTPLSQPKPNRTLNITLTDVQNIFELLYDKLEYAKKMQNNKNVAITVRDIAIFEMLMSTGISIIELTRIKVSDIDFAKQLVTVSGDKYPRTLKLTNKTYDAISAYSIMFQWVINGYFFINSLYRPFTTDSLNRVISKYLHEVGLTKATPKQLNKLAIQSLYEKNIPPETIEKILGQRYINKSEIITVPES